MSERSPRYRVAIVVGPDQDVVSWRRRHAAGEVADATPYGYDTATDFDLRWSTAGPESVLSRRLRQRLVALLGFDLVHAWRNRRLLRWADVVWTHTEREHLAVTAVQSMLPGRKAPVLAQSVWLWDRWPTWPRWRRALVAALLRAQPIECTHSRVNADASAAAVPGRRVMVLPFGTALAGVGGSDHERSADEARSRPLVLAPGNDADRDWHLLLAVAERCPHLDFRVATSRASVRAMPWPAHVRCEPTGMRAEIADLYRRASVVAVPLRPNRHASGATTCIEATGAGRAVVATRTGGIEDYLPADTRLLEVGDVDGWVRALDEVCATRTSVRTEFVADSGLTGADYVARYAAVTDDLLGGMPVGVEVSEFRSMLATDQDATEA